MMPSSGCSNVERGRYAQIRGATFASPNGAAQTIGSEKRILYRCIGERGIVLTPEAQAQLDALPERFMAFLAEIDSPAPDNARTAAIQPSDGLERRPGQEALSTGIIGARMPKAA